MDFNDRPAPGSWRPGLRIYIDYIYRSIDQSSVFFGRSTENPKHVKQNQGFGLISQHPKLGTEIVCSALKKPTEEFVRWPSKNLVSITLRDFELTASIG
jgi:hypothetical protein